ncbi:hypothetical protein CPB97_000811 [Podila verticillata]|nr:hypothetical protein CPB97_000811 [Podila verticillata]
MTSFTFIITLFVLVVHCAFAAPTLPGLPALPGVPAFPNFAAFTEVEHRDAAPKPWVDVGPVPETQVISVSIGFKLPNLPGFALQALDISMPGSSTYRNFMSADQINLLLDPAKKDVDFVLSWLKTFDIDATHDHQWLTLSMPVGLLNKLVQANYHIYRNPSTGETIIRALSYSIPTVLTPIIDVVLPGTSFDGDLSHLPPPSTTAPPLAKRFVKRADCNSQVTPACLQSLYGIPTTRATQPLNVIAVPGFLNEFANQADLNTFATQFRPDMMPRPTFTEQFIDGGKNSQDITQAGLEANLDIQYTAGLATGVPTVFISSGQANMNGFINIANFLLQQATPPTVLSISYGFNENVVSTTEANKLCDIFMQLGARGTSILVASGDGGVGGSRPSDTCTSFVPTFPASCPWVTTVGATAGQPEVGAGLSAGGFSNIFPRPDYQQNAVTEYFSQIGNKYEGRYNRTSRAFPDISAQGEHIAIAYKGQTTLVDGTSASAPIVAAIIALLNDQTLFKYGKPLGFLNPFIYKNPGIWNDVTQGSNPSCNSPGFPAAAGWDPVTGMGTPNFQKWAAAVGV